MEGALGASLVGAYSGREGGELPQVFGDLLGRREAAFERVLVRAVACVGDSGEGLFCRMRDWCRQRSADKYVEQGETRSAHENIS